MSTSLTTLINETESSLTINSGYTHLESFTRKDETIIANFLNYENNLKPHYQENKDWKILTPEISKPKKRLLKFKSQIGSFKKQGNSLIEEGKLSSFGVDSETISAFGDLPSTLYRCADMMGKFYESIVASTKEVAFEKAMTYEELLESKEGRNEIFRNIFPDSRQFEFYCDVVTKMSATMLGISYNMMDKLDDIVNGDKKSNFIVNFAAKRGFKKISKQLPPKRVAELFIRDELNYSSKRAREVYSNQLIQN